MLTLTEFSKKSGADPEIFYISVLNILNVFWTFSNISNPWTYLNL